MAKIITDLNKIKDLLSRGVEDVFVRDHLAGRLKKGDKLRVKLGIDPTGPKLHLGRAITLWKLRAFQDLGHQVVLVIGDFTTLVGDPSDKLAKRPMLNQEQIKSNMSHYKEQVGKILDLSRVEWCYNSSWLSKLSFLDAAQLAESFSLQQMVARRNFKDRWDKKIEISMRELMYPLMQGYDSVAIKADVELGGFDQLFNLMAGRKIQEYYKQPAQDILITQMLEGTDGRKMSTSWGNVVNIVDEPGEMYGKLMALRDEYIPKYLLLTTRLPILEVNNFVKELKGGANPKVIKSILAKEVVELYYSKTEAQKAEMEFEKIHKQGGLPEEIKESPLPKGKKVLLVVDLLIYLGLSKSKSEARRLVEQKGVKVAGQVVDNWQAEIVLKKGLVVQVGSRRFAKFK